MDSYSLLRLWFGLSDRVGRLPCAATGVSLTMLKYVVEASLIRVCTGITFTPMDFINPLFSVRSRSIAMGPEWLGVFLFAWSFPFLWIAISMSVRRAADGGLSPWAGLTVLVPIDGHGVGATRRCEFTTGTFVEPITKWEPGRRLAFDVTDQPAPMFELSPYRHVHPLHPPARTSACQEVFGIGWKKRSLIGLRGLDGI